MAGQKNLAPPTTASAQCLRLSERFFHLILFWLLKMSPSNAGIVTSAHSVAIDAFYPVRLSGSNFLSIQFFTSF